MASHTKTFRFSNRTVENAKALVEMGLSRSMTDAIETALEHIVTEEKTKRMLQNSHAQTRT